LQPVRDPAAQPSADVAVWTLPAGLAAARGAIPGVPAAAIDSLVAKPTTIHRHAKFVTPNNTPVTLFAFRVTAGVTF
jgi:hypothetical protein